MPAIPSVGGILPPSANIAQRCFGFYRAALVLVSSRVAGAQSPNRRPHVRARNMHRSVQSHKDHWAAAPSSPHASQRPHGSQHRRDGEALNAPEIWRICAPKNVAAKRLLASTLALHSRRTNVPCVARLPNGVVTSLGSGPSLVQPAPKSRSGQLMELSWCGDRIPSHRSHIPVIQLKFIGFWRAFVATTT